MKTNKQTNQKPKSQTFFRMNITTMQMSVEGAVEIDRMVKNTTHVNFE